MGPVLFKPLHLIQALAWWFTIGGDRYPLLHALKRLPFALYPSEAFRLSRIGQKYRIEFDRRCPRSFTIKNISPEFKSTLSVETGSSVRPRLLGRWIGSYFFGSAILWMLGLQWVIFKGGGYLKWDLGHRVQSGELALKQGCDFKCAEHIITSNVMALLILIFLLLPPLTGVIGLINSFRKSGAPVSVRRVQTIDAIVVALFLGIPSMNEFFSQKSEEMWLRASALNSRYGFSWQVAWQKLSGSEAQPDRALASDAAVSNTAISNTAGQDPAVEAPQTSSSPDSSGE